ncbi:MAG: hypothetical protein AAFW73_00585 [Bacteroidota bacterium]
MIFRTLILLLFFSFGTTSLQAGGGWPQPQGHGYFKLFQWWVIADQHFTDLGGIDPNVTNGIFNTGFYGEYGITNRLTGIVYLPFFSRAYFNNTVSGTTGEVLIPGEAINSFGDTDIGLQYGLITKGPVVWSATLRLGIPLGNSAGGSEGNLQTGDGEFNQLLRFDASTSFRLGKLNSYASVYGGYNNRTRGFSDELHFGAEVGVSFLKDHRLTTIFRLIGTRSMKNGSLNDGINNTSIFANNSEFISLSPELAYQLDDHWGVSASFASAISGKIIFANPSYSVGVFYRW